MMNAKYLHITIAIWLLAAAPMGFAESFPNRPTAYELEGIVILGKECILGVNERCYATQYQIDPVAYQVDPPFVKTNCYGWYLDQDTMGTMASAIKSLVPYFYDKELSLSVTTNLAVTSLWAQLSIGDGTNKFTSTPASGTNAAAYGDDPWRICEQVLEERNNVLEALKWGIGPAFQDVFPTMWIGGSGCGFDESSYNTLYRNGTPTVIFGDIPVSVELYAGPCFRFDDYVEIDETKYDSTSWCIWWEHDCEDGTIGERTYLPDLYFGSFSTGEDIIGDIWDTKRGAIGIGSSLTTGHALWDWDFQYCTDEY